MNAWGLVEAAGWSGGILALVREAGNAITVWRLRRIAAMLPARIPAAARRRPGVRVGHVPSVRYANSCGNCARRIVGAHPLCVCYPGPTCRMCGRELRDHGATSAVDDPDLATLMWTCPRR
ncbi:MAG: hypothetical protein ACREU5_12710 [Burkholderiales bacterium]